MKSLYDIHYHAFDLSHANLSAFLERLIHHKSNRSMLQRVIRITRGIPKIFQYIKLPQRIRNTLAVFEYPIEDHFLIIEYYLKNPDDKKIKVIKNNKIIISNNLQFDKLVICPLIMDFGQVQPELRHKGVYNEMPGKPIVRQTVDLFNAINNYYSYDLVKDSKGKFVKIPNSKPQDKPFIILPFLGINPENYKNDEQEDKIGDIFAQYFTDYNNDGQQKRKTRAFTDSINAFLAFDGRLTENKDGVEVNIPRPNMFFGVKVYPPLGFNPTSTSSNRLFELCMHYKLPITTHCSDGGFVTVSSKKAESYTNPEKSWKRVLEKNKKLTLNYAHFGSQRGRQEKWKRTIANQINKFDDVYTDISSLAFTTKYFSNEEKWIRRNGNSKIKDRLLYGSDFSINLIKCDSYNHYLKNLANCNKNLVDKICTNNPEMFLFEF